MSTKSIKISNILTDNGQFYSRKFLLESVPEQTCYTHSFNTFGILSPVIVYKDEKGKLHLVDGEKRIQYAKQFRVKIIRASVLPETTPITDIITLIFCNKRYEITESVINKIQFICFAASLNAPESWILQSLCIPFEFKPHRDFLCDCERINSLPVELKFFCHEKRFPLKHVVNLTYYPRDLLIQITKWISALQLTASTLDEIASSLNDYLKRENKKISDFLSEPEVQEILNSSISPRGKNQKLRQLIYLKRFPILSETNSKIQKTLESMNLPKEININWDKTLENKNMNLSINIQDSKQWPDILDTIKSNEVKDAIKAILNEL